MPISDCFGARRIHRPVGAEVLGSSQLSGIPGCPPVASIIEGSKVKFT